MKQVEHKLSTHWPLVPKQGLRPNPDIPAQVSFLYLPGNPVTRLWSSRMVVNISLAGNSIRRGMQRSAQPPTVLCNTFFVLDEKTWANRCPEH